MSGIRLDNVSASFGGKRVLGPVSLETRAGETVILVGKSGAGKSTLLQIMYQEWCRDAAYIPQELGLVQAFLERHITGTPVSVQKSATITRSGWITVAPPLSTDAYLIDPVNCAKNLPL